MNPHVSVRCTPAADGWACRVDIAEGGRTTHHEVTVSAAELARLAPGAAEPTELVERSFAFLVARESKDSILDRFALSVIGRYFPDYERTIRR